MWAELAMAMNSGAKGQASPGGAAGFTAFLPIIFMLLIFYWLLIRPQMKEKRRHQEMITALQRGDRIVTTGGILGKIVNLTDETLTIEVGNKLRLDILRSAVRSLQDSAGDAEVQ